MDASIRQLILYANTIDEVSGVKVLLQAYKSLQQAFNEAKTNEGAETCGSDLYVQCAEIAYKLKQEKVCQECLHMYFNGVPLTNQFLCRAYLCQAQLLSPKTADDVENFETSVVYLLKAINFAKDKARYHFIVYNASVLYWKIARPFLRDGYKAVLRQSLHQIVKALELINDHDHEWRAQLMITLVESFVDGGSLKEAASSSQAAAKFCAKQAPSRYKDILALQIKHKLVDVNKINKEVSGVPEFNAFFKLHKLKSNLKSDKPNFDVTLELQKLLSIVSGRNLQPSTPASKPTSRDRKTRPLKEESSVALEDSPLLLSAPLEFNPLLNIDGAVVDVDLFKNSVRPFLLIEIARLCVEIDQVQLTKTCLSLLKECDIKDSNMMMEIEFVESELMVKELGDQQEAYTKTSVEVRLAAVKKMDQAIQNAVRSGNANTIQGACATQWNLCLPLLQRNLRKHVRSPLSRVAQALEDIQSLQMNLRCQVHTELAKCEEAVEQIEAAVKHLNKALILDESGTYRDRLQTMLHRLQLSTQLYRNPDRPEDVAAIIIEQSRKSSDSGAIDMKRSLLVKAGLALAPDAFQNVLDSEDELKAKSGLKGATSLISLLGARANHWNKCVKKAPGHLKRLGNENDRERARLWIDLTKTARQQQIWDVCRVSATFCLLYDDGRWSVPAKEATDDKSEATRSNPGKKGLRSAGTDDRSPVEDDGRESEFQQPDADLLRFFAEVRFIHGEALIQLLRDEGLKLNEDPTPPAPEHHLQSYHHKVTIEDTQQDDAEWRVYADWIHDLNNKASDAFLRAIELGIELEESWVICSGAVYLWNYNQHLISDAKYTQLVPVFERVLFGLQKIGHSSIAVLLVRICDAIAKGILIPLIPDPSDATPLIQTAKESRKKTGGKGGADKSSAPASNFLTVSPDGIEDLNKALSICEYALQVTNGSKLSDCVPTEVRHQVLATWVQVKQMLQQQIAPPYGSENEKLPRQQAMTKALVLLEMLTLNNNKMMPFTVLEIYEVCNIVEESDWDDRCVELEVWTRLTQLALQQKDHELVKRCSERALQLENVTAGKRKVKIKSRLTHRDKTALEMLSTASCLLGESLMAQCASNPPARRQAMHCFINSSKFAKDAGNFAMVMAASRRWWNAALPLITAPLERELLRPSIEALISSIFSVMKFMKNDNLTEVSSSESSLQIQESELNDLGDAATVESEVNINDPVDDRSVMAALYALLIQTYEDKGDWEKGLAVADKAIRNMPRTNHRLLLFKHRIIMKAKLGKNVETDIAKFKDESESYVANTWHRVALSSCDRYEQLSAFQKSIEALQSDDMRWQKFEYLLQLAAWMFSHEFTVLDTTNIVEWACDVLLTMKFDIEVKKKKKGASRDKKRSGKLAKAMLKSQEAQKNQELKGQEEKFEEVIISKKLGVKQVNPILTFDDLKSTRQLEGLIRSHVMMAMICGKGSDQHRVHCQLAYMFVLRLWKISLTSAGVTLKTMPKPTPVEGEKKGGPKSANKGAQPASDKPKRKGPLDALPSSTSDWAMYDVPDEIKQAFIYDKTHCGMNKLTITCAGLTVFYLLQLSEFLRDSGFNHLSLPVLSLASIITDNILQSPSWHQLIIIKQVTVCYELHLIKAAKYWENMIRSKLLPEEEQIKSRQDLELKDIYKALARKEEQRIRTANTDSTEVENKTSLTFSSESEMNALTGPVTLLGRKVGAIYPSEIWTEKARLLLKLGYYQSCRKLLNESLTVANYYENDSWLADAYHVLADLAVHEGNTGQALQLIKKAQNVGGDELFWQENIYLLIDAITLNPNPSPEDFVMVSSVVHHSISCLDTLIERRPTKKPTISCLRASLVSHLCFMKLSIKHGSTLEQLDKLEEAENTLEELGFYRKLAHIRVKHASVLLDYSRNLPNQHEYVLKAISLLRSSAAQLTSLCTDILVVDGDKGVTLPVCRELQNVQLHLVSTMLHAASLSIEEDRAIEAEEAAKAELQRKVEEYVGLSKQYLNEIEKEWDLVRKSFLQQSFSVLTTLHTSLPDRQPLRAEWLYLYGHCLHLLSIDCFSLPSDHHWKIFNNLPDSLTATPLDNSKKESIAVGQENKENTLLAMDGEEEEEKEEEDSIEEELVFEENQSSEKILKLNKQSELSLKYVGHATEVLAQCIEIALSLQEIEIVSKASIELVECSAQFDPALAVAYLFMYQSAEFSKSTKALLIKASPNPTTSQFSAMMHQESWLKKDYISSGLESCLIRQSILKRMDERFVAWRRTKLSPNHLSLIKDFPPTFNLVALQPSPDQRYLYCAIMAKLKPSSGPTETKGKSKEKIQSAAPAPRVFITRVELNNDMHSDILEEYSDFQNQWMSFLLQKEYQTHQMMTRKMMLQELSKDVDETNIAGNVLEDHDAEEFRLKEEFSKIMSDVEEFFSPISSFIHSKLMVPISEDAADRTPENPGDPEQIIILAPQTLQKYPLESLKCLQGRYLSSVTRDFSLQFLHWRCMEDPEDPYMKKWDPKTPKTPKGKKSGKGSAKAAAPKEPGVGSKSIESHNVHFIVDPCNDASETEKHPPEKVFRDLLQIHSNTVANRWSGLYGTESNPSPGQWEDFMQRCSMFIYYGMERFIAQYPPSKYPSLNLRPTQLMLLFDKAQSNKSFRRQSKIDVDKTHSLLAMEKPLETVMLLSVCGVNSVCLNTAHTSCEENATKLQALIAYMLQGRPVGEGVRLLALPPPEVPPEDTDELKPESSEPAITSQSPESERDSSSPIEEVQLSTFNLVLFGLPNLVFA